MVMTIEERALRAEARKVAQKRAGAVADEQRAQRHEAKRKEWVETGAYLTFEQMMAGEPCRGCGVPLVTPGYRQPSYVGKGTMYYTDEERVQAKADGEAKDREFKDRHPDCHDGRWSMQGGRDEHCMNCCPPAPFGPATLDKLRGIFNSPMGKTPEHMKNRWLLTLTCGHTREATAHMDHQTYTAIPVRCEMCGETRGVVDTKNLGRAAEPPKPPKPTAREISREEAAKRVAAQRAALQEAERVLSMLSETTDS